MKTILTNNDVKNIVENIFTTNNEPIKVKDEYGNVEETTFKDLLNIKFYAWRNNVVHDGGGNQFYVDEWVESLDYNMNKTFGLVEITDSSVVASQDIDSATIEAKITFLCSVNVVQNLDYYLLKLRNTYSGIAQDIQTANGEIRKAYINIGCLLYDDQPVNTPNGEMLTVSANIDIDYLTDALGYRDIKFEISHNYFTAQTPQQIVFEELPLTKATAQTIITSQAVVKQNKPNQQGFKPTSATNITTMAFFDFNQDFMTWLDDIFWGTCAISKNGSAITSTDTEFPICLKVTTRNNIYILYYIIDNIEKVYTNSEFTLCSMTLKLKS